jgi:hypothetical protein
MARVLTAERVLFIGTQFSILYTSKWVGAQRGSIREQSMSKETYFMSKETSYMSKET